LYTNLRNAESLSPSTRQKTVFMVRVSLLLTLLLLAGCGDQRVTQPFINNAGVPEAILQQAWRFAQLNIAYNKVVVNATEVTLYGDGVKPVLSQPDPRALKLDPWGIIVEAKAADANSSDHSISCGAGRCASFAQFSSNKVVVSDYWLQNEPVPVLQYQFESLILKKLGYDVKGR